MVGACVAPFGLVSAPINPAWVYLTLSDTRAAYVWSKRDPGLAYRTSTTLGWAMSGLRTERGGHDIAVVGRHRGYPCRDVGVVFLRLFLVGEKACTACGRRMFSCTSGCYLTRSGKTSFRVPPRSAWPDAPPSARSSTLDAQVISFRTLLTCREGVHEHDRGHPTGILMDARHVRGDSSPGEVRHRQGLSHP